MTFEVLTYLGFSYIQKPQFRVKYPTLGLRTFQATSLQLV
jgi:hypothetical protein